MGYRLAHPGMAGQIDKLRNTRSRRVEQVFAALRQPSQTLQICQYSTQALRSSLIACRDKSIEKPWGMLPIAWKGSD